MKTRTNEAAWVESTQRWRISVQADGERKQFYSSTAGRRGKLEAERKADEWLRDRSAKTMTVDQLTDSYLSALMERTVRLGRSSAMHKKMESVARIWVRPRIGRKKTDKVTLADYQAVIDAAFDAGRSRKMLTHISTLLNGLYKYAHQHRITMERPEVEIYEEAPRNEREALTADAVRTLFAEDTETVYGRSRASWYIHAWRLMCLLGLRHGEAAALRWEDIEDGTLTVSRALNSLGEITHGKTRAARRRIVLFDMAEDELEAQREQLRAEGIISPWVFPDRITGEPDYAAMYKRWLIFCRSHDMGRVNLHELRHTTVSLMMGHISTDLLKPVVGHTDAMDTFGTYGHITEDGLQQVAGTMSAVFHRLVD